MSRIKVKNFGPIKEGCIENDGWIDIEKVSVFIGNQGSGKSTIAKLISTLIWIEKELVRRNSYSVSVTSPTRFLEICHYQNIHNYFNEFTRFIYEGDAMRISLENSIFSPTFFNELNRKIISPIEIYKILGKIYDLPKIMYVPAERNFLSIVKDPNSLKNLPSPLYTFLDEYEKAKKNIEKGLTLPIGDVKFQYDSNTSNSFLIGNDYEINLTEASSGFQSYVPLFLVSRHLSKMIGTENSLTSVAISLKEQKELRDEIEMILTNKNLSEVVKQAALETLSSKFKYAAFINIVEEPEQNLFPSSQRQILNSLLEFNNSTEANKLILTTHSPYIINYLSTAIQGAYLKNKIDESDTHHDEDIKKLNAIVPLKSVVDAKDVVIYQMDEKDGTIKKLPSYEGIPSDKNYLNEMLADGNHIFDALLELEESI